MPYLAKEWERGLGIQRQEGHSQDDKKSRWLVIRCLPCHIDGTTQINLSLVIALFPGKIPNLNSYRQLREGQWFLLNPQDLHCLQLKIIHMPKQHILGKSVLNPHIVHKRSVKQLNSWPRNPSVKLRQKRWKECNPQ